MLSQVKIHVRKGVDMQQNGVYDLLKMLEISLEEGFSIVPRKYTIVKTREIETLIDELIETGGINSCPHGRPIMQSFTNRSTMYINFQNVTASF